MVVNICSEKPIAYEDISNADVNKAIAAADNAILNGWSRRGYPPISLTDIQWEMADGGKRSWNFYIHSWDMLDSIIKSYEITEKSKYLDVILQVVSSWISFIETSKAVDSSMAWYDMAVGLRSYRLAYIVDVCSRIGKFDKSKLKKMFSILKKHAEYLEDDKNIVFHNNHGFYQVAGQVAIGRRFSSRSALYSRALVIGEKRFEAMFEQQFSSDGCHKEHSPDYHRMVCESLKGIVDSGLISNDAIANKASKIEDNLYWFVLPDQTIANFGDSDARLMKRSPSQAVLKWSSKHLIAAITGGAEGSWPKEDQAIFKSGGYFVVKNRQIIEESSNRPQHQSYFALSACFHSRTHKHADDLTFIWSEGHANIYVDAGRYGYLGKAEQGSALWHDGYWYSDPNRVYCESTRAHNTLEFDGLNYSRKGVTPYGSALQRCGKSDSGVYWAETEVYHFRTIRRCRVIFYLPNEWLITFDWFKDNSGDLHSVKQWFHTAPEHEVEDIATGFSIALQGETRRLTVSSLVDGNLKKNMHVGELEPEMNGWYSPKERTIVPAYAFNYEKSDVSTYIFATLSNLSGETIVDYTASNVTGSGRKGHFVWKDERGTHRLNFERDKNLDVEFVLNYEVQ